MSEFNIGDKVYLECEVVNKDVSDNTYKLRYEDWGDMDTTTDYVKDDVLHPTDEAYNKGLNDAWDLAKKIVLSDGDGGYSCDELKNIFGYRSPASIFKAFTPQEALAKVKAYEERNEIKVGDVVKFRGDCIESIVTKVDGYIVYRLFKDGSCNLFHYNKGDLEKTGKHFDSIDEFMRS